jgi:hypothetical protein
MDLNATMPKGNAVIINRLNKIKILGLIRDFGTISRAELVTKSGLSAPTVTRIVNSLINEEKLVLSVGMGNSSGGRQCADFSAVFFSQRLNQLFDGDDFVYSVGIGPRKSKSSVEVPFLGVAQCQSNTIRHIPEIAASQALPGAFESLFDA